MEDRLNYIGIDFIVSTEEEKAKFCYGSFIMPSINKIILEGYQNTIEITNNEEIKHY